MVLCIYTKADPLHSRPPSCFLQRKHTVTHTQYLTLANCPSQCTHTQPPRLFHSKENCCASNSQHCETRVGGNLRSKRTAYSGELKQHHNTQHVADGSTRYLSKGHVRCTLVQLHNVRQFYTAEQQNLPVKGASRKFLRTAQGSGAMARQETVALAKALYYGRVLWRDTGKEHVCQLPEADRRECSSAWRARDRMRIPKPNPNLLFECTVPVGTRTPHGPM